MSSGRIDWIELTGTSGGSVRVPVMVALATSGLIRDMVVGSTTSGKRSNATAAISDESNALVQEALAELPLVAPGVVAFALPNISGATLAVMAPYWAHLSSLGPRASPNLLATLKDHNMPLREPLELTLGIAELRIANDILSSTNDERRVDDDDDDDDVDGDDENAEHYLPFVKVLRAANFMDMPSLLHLVCARIAELMGSMVGTHLPSTSAQTTSGVTDADLAEIVVEATLDAIENDIVPQDAAGVLLSYFCVDGPTSSALCDIFPELIPSVATAESLWSSSTGPLNSANFRFDVTNPTHVAVLAARLALDPTTLVSLSTSTTNAVTLQELVRAKLPVERLHLSHCRDLGDDCCDVLAILASSSSLKSVNLNGCLKISRVAVMRLRETVPSLQVVHDVGVL